MTFLVRLFSFNAALTPFSIVTKYLDSLTEKDLMVPVQPLSSACPTRPLTMTWSLGTNFGVVVSMDILLLVISEKERFCVGVMMVL